MSNGMSGRVDHVPQAKPRFTAALSGSRSDHPRIPRARPFASRFSATLVVYDSASGDDGATRIARQGLSSAPGREAAAALRGRSSLRNSRSASRRATRRALALFSHATEHKPRSVDHAPAPAEERLEFELTPTPRPAQGDPSSATSSTARLRAHACRSRGPGRALVGSPRSSEAGLLPTRILSARGTSIGIAGAARPRLALQVNSTTAAGTARHVGTRRLVGSSVEALACRSSERPADCTGAAGASGGRPDSRRRRSRAPRAAAAVAEGAERSVLRVSRSASAGDQIPSRAVRRRA